MPTVFLSSCIQTRRNLAPNSLICADVPLINYSLTHVWWPCKWQPCFPRLRQCTLTDITQGSISSDTQWQIGPSSLTTWLSRYQSKTLTHLLPVFVGIIQYLHRTVPRYRCSCTSPQTGKCSRLKDVCDSVALRYITGRDGCKTHARWNCCLLIVTMIMKISNTTTNSHFTTINTVLGDIPS